jgi:hypothetical protein
MREIFCHSSLAEAIGRAPLQRRRLGKPTPPARTRNTSGTRLEVPRLSWRRGSVALASGARAALNGGKLAVVRQSSVRPEVIGGLVPRRPNASPSHLE